MASVLERAPRRRLPLPSKSGTGCENRELPLPNGMISLAARTLPAFHFFRSTNALCFALTVISPLFDGTEHLNVGSTTAEEILVNGDPFDFRVRI